MNGRPPRSAKRKSSGIVIRPVFSHSSDGAITGMNISWPPIASISSRMIETIFSWTRHPAGRKSRAQR